MRSKSKRIDAKELIEKILTFLFDVQDAQNQEDSHAALDALKAFLEGMDARERKAVWDACGDESINTLVSYFVMSSKNDDEELSAIDRFYLNTYWPVFFSSADWAQNKIESSWRDGLEKAEAGFFECVKLATELPWNRDFFAAEAEAMKKELIAEGKKEFSTRADAQKAAESSLSVLIKGARHKWERADLQENGIPRPNLWAQIAGKPTEDFYSEACVLCEAAGLCSPILLFTPGSQVFNLVVPFLPENAFEQKEESDNPSIETDVPGKPKIKTEPLSTNAQDPDALKKNFEFYLATPEGNATLAFFKDFAKHFANRFKINAFRSFVEKLLDYPAYNEGFGTPDEEFMFRIETPLECKDFDAFCAMCNDFLDNPALWENAREVQWGMPQLSCLLFAWYPEYAFPYLLPVHFFKAKKVFEYLGIPLPVMPQRNDHIGRCCYILDLFVAVHEFREDNGFSPEEMCCLLYGYAPHFLVSYVNTNPVPANRVCIVGATQADAESDYLQHPHEDCVQYWQGNSEMTPGDIVLVYETSPYCRIRTIWRAVSPGFDDPFHYFSGKVIVGHPMQIPPIAYRDLKADPVWGKKGLVKASMIGVRGQSCSVEEYEALKAMIHRKDPSFPLETLPMPPEYAQFFHENIKVERDVEALLLEPLLKRLGFGPSDWVRQLELRMGRGDRVFPDYALGVTGDKNTRAAEFVWEAKYRIPSQKQLEIDFGQARSYALRLQSKALGLVALEGVWVAGADGGFSFRKLVHYYWKDLENPETLSKLKQLFRKG